MNVPKPIECDNCKKTNDLIKILLGWECLYCGHKHFDNSKGETFQVSLPKSTSNKVIINKDAVTIVTKSPEINIKPEKFYPIYRRESSVKSKNRHFVTCSSCGEIFMQTKGHWAYCRVCGR